MSMGADIEDTLIQHGIKHNMSPKTIADLCQQIMYDLERYVFDGDDERERRRFMRLYNKARKEAK